MPVHEPGRRLMHDIKLKFVQKRVGGHGGRSTNASLSLTSMIDFLIVVVVIRTATAGSQEATHVDRELTTRGRVFAVPLTSVGDG